MTTFEEENNQTDGPDGGDTSALQPKAAKPPRRGHYGGVDDGWLSDPPVGWTTRPAGDSAPPATREKPRRSFWNMFIRDVGIPLLVAVALVFGGLAAVAKPYKIPTGSMEPTIQVNDRILANRLVYRFKDIERGDVIVFDPPAVPGVDTSTPYVKRVVGLPGDTVEIREGRTLVNGKEFIVDQVTERPFYSRSEETVPDGMLFVLGDNRNSSQDSHIWGYLPTDNVIGRADIIYWPPDSFDWLG